MYVLPFSDAILLVAGVVVAIVRRLLRFINHCNGLQHINIDSAQVLHTKLKISFYYFSLLFGLNAFYSSISYYYHGNSHITSLKSVSVFIIRLLVFRFWICFEHNLIFFFAVSPFYFDISSFSNCQQYLNYKFCFIQLLNILHFPFQVLKQFDLYGLFVGVEVHKYKQHNDSFVRFLFCYFRRYFKFLFALFVILCTICVLYTYIYHSGSKTDFFNNWLCFIFERTDFFFASLYFSWNFHSVY